MNPMDQITPSYRPAPLQDIRRPLPASAPAPRADFRPVPPPSLSNPVTQAVLPASPSPQPAFDELDSVLEDVNRQVAAPATAPKKRSFSLKLRKPKLPKYSFNLRRALPIIAAVVVAATLSAAATYAFKNAAKPASGQIVPGKVGTADTATEAIQAAGGQVIQPSDLSDFSQTLQSKINNLSDAQDFDAASLSDHNLGL